MGYLVYHKSTSSVGYVRKLFSDDEFEVVSEPITEDEKISLINKEIVIQCSYLFDGNGRNILLKANEWFKKYDDEFYNKYKLLFED